MRYLDDLSIDIQQLIVEELIKIVDFDKLVKLSEHDIIKRLIHTDNIYINLLRDNFLIQLYIKNVEMFHATDLMSKIMIYYKIRTIIPIINKLIRMIKFGELKDNIYFILNFNIVNFMFNFGYDIKKYYLPHLYMIKNFNDNFIETQNLQVIICNYTIPVSREIYNPTIQFVKIDDDIIVEFEQGEEYIDDNQSRYLELIANKYITMTRADVYKVLTLLVYYDVIMYNNESESIMGTYIFDE